MAPGKFKVTFVDGKGSIERVQSNESNKNLSGTVVRDGSNNKFMPNSVDQHFDNFVESIVDKVIDMRLTKKNTDLIFSMFEELIGENISMCERFFEKESKENSKSVREILSMARQQACKKISAIKTSYFRQKALSKNKYYVAPVEIPMGLKWITKIKSDSDLPDHKLVQSTFQFIPPSKTLATLFLNADFKQAFIEYNKQKQLNGCVDGVYNDYCCGNVAKNFNIFRSSDTINLQLAFDEFDACNGLKTKATVHKIFAAYFQILNIPHKYSARQNNIYLVALSPSSNFKETGCSDENIIEQIVRDLKRFDVDGIDVGDNERLKVALFNIAGDNLGMNNLFGFSGGFNARYFCRFCTCTKDETQTMTEENSSEIRTTASYDAQIKKMLLNPNLTLQQTKGVHKNCLFNDLPNFHVCRNVSADIMHDIFEGVVPYFLHEFFNYAIREKICSESDIIRRVRDFNYGILNSKNKPSLIRIERKNLGQNATQSYCIMIHLPFLFIDKKHDLNDVWPIMISLLECMRILLSYELNESDLEILAQRSKEHLSEMVRVFKVTLKPKHHNMIHHPRVIREMGPLRLTMMMKYELKHKFFTNVARKTNNFVNIAKTMAEAHQAYICTQFESMKDHIEPSNKKYLLSKDVDYESYLSYFQSIQETDITQCFALLFLKYNGRMFRKGLFIFHEKIYYKIVNVIQSNENYYLACLRYNFIGFDHSLNSIEIHETVDDSKNYTIINIKHLTISDSFEQKKAKSSTFIIAESLEMLNVV